LIEIKNKTKIEEAQQMKKIEFRSNIHVTKAGLALVSLLILLVGCGGPLANNPLLTDATTEFNKAQQDPMVVKYAPVALKEAEETLIKSRDLWTAKADKSDVDHYAYLAHQRTLIAVQTAQLNAANDELSRSEVERQQVLLDVRRSEADRSEARARSAQQDARDAQQTAQDERAQADEARKLAELLTQRVRELEARPTDRGLVLTLGDVLFETGQSSIRSQGMKSIEDLAVFLREYPERNIVIEGFTDNIGSASFNMNLSRDRANSVKSELVNRRINADRISTVGYGLQFPVANNATDAGRQQNRRVEIIISDQDGKVVPRRQ
jgi:outer membrane protein OmpA-like peptidoglycan-associated protein